MYYAMAPPTEHHVCRLPRNYINIIKSVCKLQTPRQTLAKYTISRKRQYPPPSIHRFIHHFYLCNQGTYRVAANVIRLQMKSYISVFNGVAIGLSCQKLATFGFFSIIIQAKMPPANGCAGFYLLSTVICQQLRPAAYQV